MRNTGTEYSKCIIYGSACHVLDETVDVFVGHAASRYSYLQDINRLALPVDLQTNRTVTFLANLRNLPAPLIGGLTKGPSS